MTTRNGHRWVPDGKVRTYSGALAGWNEPAPLDDYLIQLGRIVRFGGATDPEFCVLQHSYHAYLIALDVFPEVALQALLHDFAELLIGDIPKPMKMDDYTLYEKWHVELAAKSFGLDLDWSGTSWAKVKIVDDMATRAEGYYLTTGSNWPAVGITHLSLVGQIPHDRREGDLHNLVGKIVEEAAVDA